MSWLSSSKLHNWGHTDFLCCLNNTTMAFSRQFLLQIENRLCIIDPFRFFFCILLWFHEIFLLGFLTVVWNDRQIPKIDETGWNWCDLAWKLETPKLRSVTLDIHIVCLTFFLFVLLDCWILLTFCPCFHIGKVEKILIGSLDLIPSRSNDLLLHLSSPQFEFSLKVVWSNPGYLLKSFLL